MAKGRKNKPGSRTRADDLELWSEVTSTVTPLRRRLGDAPRAAKTPKASGKPSAPEAAPDRPLAALKKPAPARQVPAAPRTAPKKPAAPPLTGLDRRTSQKLTRGNTDIEGRIDLHGMGRETARTALKSFIITSRAAGKRTVLAITGKGHSPYSSHTLHGYEHVNTPERQGVIRNAFPQWLNESEFRVHVAGYQPAHPRHGGGGAFYIRLRRHKD